MKVERTHDDEKEPAEKETILERSIRAFEAGECPSSIWLEELIAIVERDKQYRMSQEDDSSDSDWYADGGENLYTTLNQDDDSEESSWINDEENFYGMDQEDVAINSVEVPNKYIEIYDTEIVYEIKRHLSYIIEELDAQRYSCESYEVNGWYEENGLYLFFVNKWLKDIAKVQVDKSRISKPFLSINMSNKEECRLFLGMIDEGIYQGFDIFRIKEFIEGV